MDWPPRSRCWTALGLIALVTFAARPVVARGDDEPGLTTPLDPSADPVEYQAPAPNPATPPAAPAPTTPAPAPGTAARASAAPVASTPAPTPADNTFTSAALRSAYNRGAAAASDLAGSNIQGRTVEMLGDLLGRIPPIPNPPPPVPGPNPPPSPGGNGNGNGRASRGLILAPSIRSFKIAEDQSPRPLDRVYYFTNYFNNVNQSINREYGAPLRSIMAYRNTFGFEKTFDEGRGSFGMQLPINTLSISSANRALGGTSTSVGDLTLIGKYALWQDRATGSLFSAGLAVTAPTGPSHFAFSRGVTNLHYTLINPYVGGIWNIDRFFVQGFNSVSVPTSSVDSTFLYNDLGVGYTVYRDDDVDALLTAVIPTVEIHVNTPLNHRGNYLRDPAGTFDVVDFTYGVNAVFTQNTRFATAIVTPVTGPRPFAFEVIAQLTVRF